jgi:hypothetical protein
MSALIYEDILIYDRSLKIILAGILAATFIAGVILIREEIEAALIMLGLTVFDALLFKAILPQRFQIFEDRLVIALGGPFAIGIPLSNIADAKSVSGRKAFVYWGIRFATSTRNVVEIVRKKGLNIVISPNNEDVFLEQLNQARSKFS